MTTPQPQASWIEECLKDESGCTPFDFLLAEFLEDVRKLNPTDYSPEFERAISAAKKKMGEILSKKESETKELVVKMIEKLGKEQIELYHGKLPFVILNGKADEEEKIAIYRQALSDLLSTLTPHKE